MNEFADLHDDLRAVARDLLGTTSDTVATTSDAAEGPTDWARMADAGWLGLEVPEALDGSGATFAETAVVAEEMGRAVTTSSYLGTAGLGVAALKSVVGSEARDSLLRGAAAGSVRLAVALAPSGDDPLADPPFRIESSGGSILLSGRAAFVVDATEADQLLLLAIDAAGDPALVNIDVGAVDSSAIDVGAVEVIDQPVLDATRRFGVVVTDRVPISEQSVWTFDSEAPGIAAQRLADRGAVAVACDSFGLGAAMIDATVVYVAARHQFDRPIGSFQAVKHACADMAVQQAIGRELLSAAVEAVATNEPDAWVAVARAKSFVCAAAVDIVGSAMQLHGGIGYTWESGIHRHLKRAVLNRTFFGSPVAHRRRLFASIGTR